MDEEDDLANRLFAEDGFCFDELLGGSSCSDELCQEQEEEEEEEEKAQDEDLLHVPKCLPPLSAVSSTSSMTSRVSLLPHSPPVRKPNERTVLTGKKEELRFKQYSHVIKIGMKKCDSDDEENQTPKKQSSKKKKKKSRKQNEDDSEEEDDEDEDQDSEEDVMKTKRNHYVIIDDVSTLELLNKLTQEKFGVSRPTTCQIEAKVNPHYYKAKEGDKSVYGKVGKCLVCDGKIHDKEPCSKVTHRMAKSLRTRKCECVVHYPCGAAWLAARQTGKTKLDDETIPCPIHN
jgi:hypothetical protein